MSQSKAKLKINQVLAASCLATTVWVTVSPTPASAGETLSNTALSGLSGGNLSDMTTGGFNGGTLSSGTLSSVGAGLTGSSATSGSSLIPANIPGADQINQFLSPLQDWMQQVTSELQTNLKSVQDLFGGLQDAIRNGQALFDDPLGALGLPDLGQILDDIHSALDISQDEATVGDIDATLVGNDLEAAAAIEAARIQADQVLSESAQAATNQQMQAITSQVSNSATVAQTSATAAQTSTDVVTQSGQVAQQSTQTAQQAQSRVSTQDAIKDLNTTTANLSTQLSQLSSQAAGQAGQLSGISSQMATSTQIDAAALARLNQLTTQGAITTQNISQINEVLQGQERSQLRQDMDETARAVEAGYSAFPLLR